MAPKRVPGAESGLEIPTPESARDTIQSLVEFALQKIPREYSSDKHWDKRKKVWAGVKLRRDGFKLSTKGRYREVRHGRWTRYEIRFPGDESKRPPVQATVQSVVPQTDSAGADAGWKINSQFSSPLDFSARVERWNYGVKWYTFTVTGHMRLSMTTTTTLSSRLDYGEFPPAMVIDPKVTAASIRIDEFNVDRVSKIGGDVAEKWGDLAAKIADEILIDDLNEGKLVEKLNRSIDKNRDDLRFSAATWLERLNQSGQSDQQSD